MCREVVEPPSLEGLKGVDVAFGDIWFGGGAGRVSAMARSFWRSFPTLTIPWFFKNRTRPRHTKKDLCLVES